MTTYPHGEPVNDGPGAGVTALVNDKAEPLSASEHHAWLRELAARFGDVEHMVRLCEAEEWRPNPGYHPGVGWFLLEIRLPHRTAKVVSTIGYSYSPQEGPTYTQMYCVLRNGIEAYLSHGDPDKAARKLREAAP